LEVTGMALVVAEDERARLLEAFATVLRARGHSEKSVGSYCGQVERFAVWYEKTCAKLDPAAVTQLDVAEYRRWMQGKGCRPATVNLALVALGRFFSWAVEEGICSFPRCGRQAGARAGPGPRWLDRRAVGALMRTVTRYGTVRDRVLIMVLLHTGLRVSEACGLRVSDVELRERSGRVRVRHGKGGKFREVPLNVTIRRVLGEYLESHHSGGEWLFLNRYGGCEAGLGVKGARRVLWVGGREHFPAGKYLAFIPLPCESRSGDRTSRIYAGGTRTPCAGARTGVARRLGRVTVSWAERGKGPRWQV